MKPFRVLVIYLAICCLLLPVLEASKSQRFQMLQVGRKIRSCISKVVCELAASPLRYGKAGTQLVVSMVAKLKLPLSGPFHSAFNFGSRSASPDRCIEQFAECSTPSSELVRIGNDIMNDDN